MSHGGNGLGPVFNATSCVACHGLGAPGGAGPDQANVVLVSVTPTGRTLPPGLERIHPGFSSARTVVLHRYGTDPNYGSWRRRLYESPGDGESITTPRNGRETVEGRIRALQAQTAPARRLRGRTIALRRTPEYVLALSERNPPSLFGAGQVDAIPSQVLLAVAQGQPGDVRGRVNRTPEGQIGRFGWKAQIASLHYTEIVRDAPDTEEGRLAAERIAALGMRKE